MRNPQICGIEEFSNLPLKKKKKKEFSNLWIPHLLLNMPFIFYIELLSMP